jgi:hypothetical protein
MDIESSNLIKINKSKQKKQNDDFSYEKDIKQLTNFLKTNLGIINITILIIAFLIFIFNKIDFNISFIFNFFSNKNLSYYQEIQDNFCNNAHLFINKELEEKIMLYNISLNHTNFDMFIYNSYDYLSYQIQLNQSLQGEATLNMLNALKYFTNKYCIIC